MEKTVTMNLRVNPSVKRQAEDVLKQLGIPMATASHCGLFGFLASLIGSAILNTVQTNGNCLSGISLYGQQLLSGISIALLIMAMIFNHFVVEKQKILYE